MAGEKVSSEWEVVEITLVNMDGLLGAGRSVAASGLTPRLNEPVPCRSGNSPNGI